MSTTHPTCGMLPPPGMRLSEQAPAQVLLHQYEGDELP